MGPAGLLTFRSQANPKQPQQLGSSHCTLAFPPHKARFPCPRRAVQAAASSRLALHKPTPVAWCRPPGQLQGTVETTLSSQGRCRWSWSWPGGCGRRWEVHGWEIHGPQCRGLLLSTPASAQRPLRKHLVLHWRLRERLQPRIRARSETTAAREPKFGSSKDAGPRPSPGPQPPDLRIRSKAPSPKAIPLKGRAGVSRAVRPKASRAEVASLAFIAGVLSFPWARQQAWAHRKEYLLGSLLLGSLCCLCPFHLSQS